MSAIETRVRKLEQAPAYATRLLAQQTLDKLAAGVPVERLTDAELDALCESIPATEKAPLAAPIAALSDAELDALLATQEVC
jgi:mRNA-degrading endonuclease toxin of MazEF toxin-antitoxin module